ncbi:hypothetical protein WMF45_12960 [Sorangium sp. So ce448]
MGRAFSELDDDLIGFLAEQRLFFVASAPSGSGAHVNLSPKGHDTFRVLDPRTVAYIDLTGSGVETIAHLRDNGRITPKVHHFLLRNVVSRWIRVTQAPRG